MGYTLKNFLKIAQSSKNDLLKAMHEMSEYRYVNDTDDTKTLESLETIQNDNETSYEYHMKKATPVKTRNYSLGSKSGSSNYENRSSNASAQIYTNNKGQYYDNTEKENTDRQNYHQKRKHSH